MKGEYTSGFPYQVLTLWLLQDHCKWAAKQVGSQWAAKRVGSQWAAKQVGSQWVVKQVGS